MQRRQLLSPRHVLGARAPKARPPGVRAAAEASREGAHVQQAFPGLPPRRPHTRVLTPVSLPTAWPPSRLYLGGLSPLSAANQDHLERFLENTLPRPHSEDPLHGWVTG